MLEVVALQTYFPVEFAYIVSFLEFEVLMLYPGSFPSVSKGVTVLFFCFKAEVFNSGIK